MAQNSRTEQEAVNDALRELGVDSVDEFITVANSLTVVCRSCCNAARVFLPVISSVDGELKLISGPARAYELQKLALAVMRNYDIMIVRGKRQYVAWVRGTALGTAFLIVCAKCQAESVVSYRAGSLADLELISGSSEKSALAQEREGLVVSALRQLEIKLKTGERSSEAVRMDWHEKGNRESEVGRFKEAVLCYDKALAINPRVAGTWRDKGAALSKAGELAEAIKSYDKSLDLNPSDPVTWFDKGTTLKRMGRVKDAVECFDRAIAIDRTDPDVWVNKGLAVQELGKKDAALECFNCALKLNQKHLEALLNMGALLGESGRLQEAMQCFESVLALNPIDEDGWFGKAAVLLQMNRRPDARAAFEKFLAVSQRGDPRRDVAQQQIRRLDG
jgi:tetratricopeptide (TPR) repeat protein